MSVERIVLLPQDEPFYHRDSDLVLKWKFNFKYLSEIQIYCTWNIWSHFVNINCDERIQVGLQVPRDIEITVKTIKWMNQENATGWVGRGYGLEATVHRHGFLIMESK